MPKTRALKPDLSLDRAPVPARHAAAPRTRSVRRSAVGTAADAIGPIGRGCEIFALSNGHFSIIDVIEHVLAATGPAALDLATWTAADGDLRRAHAFFLQQRITSVRLVVDPSFRTRKPEFCATLVELFGNDAIRTLPLHGKFALIRNGQWRVAIRTSMNLNVNKRIETIEISDDADLGAFLGSFVDEVFTRSAAANFTTQSSGQLAWQPPPSRRLAF